MFSLVPDSAGSLVLVKTAVLKLGVLQTVIVDNKDGLWSESIKKNSHAAGPASQENIWSC